MKKAILLLLSIQLCLPTFGQVPYHKQKLNVNRWYNSIQADSLPKGSREKTIYFPKHNYRIIGQFHKGILTAGQIEQFMTQKMMIFCFSGVKCHTREITFS